MKLSCRSCVQQPVVSKITGKQKPAAGSSSWLYFLRDVYVWSLIPVTNLYISKSKNPGLWRKRDRKKIWSWVHGICGLVTAVGWFPASSLGSAYLFRNHAGDSLLVPTFMQFLTTQFLLLYLWHVENIWMKGQCVAHLILCLSSFLLLVIFL